MFDDIYVTKGSYVYNKRTCRLFMVSEDTREILNKYSGEEELQKTAPELYQKILPEIHKLKKERELALTEDENGLTTLQLIVCNNCNLACKYCYAHAGTYGRESSKMSFETAKDAIDIMFARFNRIEAVMFFGGEPLLCIEVIAQICQYLFDVYRGRFSKIGMMSNLYDLSETALEIIKKYNIQVSTSLDGTEEMNQYRVTHLGENSYSQVVNNINRLYQETGQPVSVEATMSNLHSDIGCDAPELLSTLSNIIPVKNYTVNPIICFSESMKDCLYKNEDKDVIVDLENFIETGVCDMRINDLVSVMTGINCNDRFCTAGEFQYSILPDGDIYPCHIYCLGKAKEFCLGNVNAFDAKKFEENRKKVIRLNCKDSYEKCRDCINRAVCSSCLGTSLVTSGVVLPDDEFCQRKEEYYNELIEVFAEVVGAPEKMQKFKNRIKEARELCHTC